MEVYTAPRVREPTGQRESSKPNPAPVYLATLQWSDPLKTPLVYSGIFVFRRSVRSWSDTPPFSVQKGFKSQSVVFSIQVWIAIDGSLFLSQLIRCLSPPSPVWRESIWFLRSKKSKLSLPPTFFFWKGGDNWSQKTDSIFQCQH